MVSKVHLLLILIYLSPNLALIEKDNYYEACWEQCYQSIQSIFAPSELKAYEVEAARFLDIGTYARYLKNTESVNGTAILLDYTYSKWHDPDINSMLQPHEDGNALWKLQRETAAITILMLGADRNRNPISLIQFDEENAWRCNQLSCLDQCEASEILLNRHGEMLKDVRMDDDSKYDANVEAACRVAYKSFEYCIDEDIRNEMAISFFNSEFHYNVEKKYKQTYSPCSTHFETRMAIGIHAAKKHELKQWSSKDDLGTYYDEIHNYKELRSIQPTMEISEMLSKCMMTECCPSTWTDDVVADPNTAVCTKSTDDFGAMEVDDPQHPLTQGGLTS